MLRSRLSLVGVLTLAAAGLLAVVEAGYPPLRTLAARRSLEGAVVLLFLGALAAVGLPHRRRAGLGRSRLGIRRAGPPAWAWLALLTAGAAALRFYGLGRDLWLDEVATVIHCMRRPLLEMLQVYPEANQHFLNTLLGGLSLRLLGESPFAVRLPAALMGIAAVPALYALARLWGREREALLGAALLALSYHHVWFSQNARGYAGMVFFVLVGTRALLLALAHDRPRHWVLYAAAMALGMLSLLNTAFVLCGHVLVAAWLARRRPPLLGRLFLAAYGAGALALLVMSPALPAMLRFYARGAPQMGWSDPLSLARVVAANVGTGAALLLAGALAAWGLRDYLRRQAPVAALFLLPPLWNVLALTLLRFGAYPRSFLYLLPAALLFLVRGTLTLPLRRPWFPPFAAALLLLAAAVHLSRNYRWPKQDYTGALRYVMARRGPDEVVCAVGWAGIVYHDYYAPGLPFIVRRADLERLLAAHRRVWVLYSFTRDLKRFYPEIEALLRERFQVVRVFPGTLWDGALYVAASPPP